MKELNQFIKPIIDWFVTQIGQIREIARELTTKIPGIGKFLTDNIEIVLLGFALIVGVILIKPIVKWTLVVGLLGTVTAFAVSAYFCLPFLSVLPYAIGGVSILILATK